MKLPRDVSGERLSATLCRQWKYRGLHKSGSHIILETEEPSHHRIAVPDHAFLRVGTFNPILRTVAATKVSRAKRLSARFEHRMHGLRRIAVSLNPVYGPALSECRTIRSEGGLTLPQRRPETPRISVRIRDFSTGATS